MVFNWQYLVKNWIMHLKCFLKLKEEFKICVLEYFKSVNIVKSQNIF